MKNEYENAMYLYDMHLNEPTVIDFNDGYALSIVPEYGYHYRDNEGYMHIAKRNNPQSIELNCLILEEKEDYYEIVEDSHLYFPTEKELFAYLKFRIKEKVTNKKQVS